MPNPYRMGQEVDSAMGAERNMREDVLKLSTYGVPDELVSSYAARRVAASWEIL